MAPPTPIDPMNHAARSVGQPPTIPISKGQAEGGDGSRTVLVEIHVLSDGKTEVKLLASTGDEKLDQSIAALLAGWRWEPAFKHGIPVESKEQVQIPLGSD